MVLYKLAVQNALKDHQFTDSVAICKANSKKEAIEKFKEMYSFPNMEKYVSEAYFNKYGIAVLTDY